MEEMAANINVHQLVIDRAKEEYVYYTVIQAHYYCIKLYVKFFLIIYMLGLWSKNSTDVLLFVLCSG